MPASTAFLGIDPDAAASRHPMSSDRIRIRGARQNNLRNLDLDIVTGELTVITGVSGSGKSSLAFDTLYAEGQRRYVETFSPYARQFLDRMDRPAVDRIDGVLPAIAIDQTNPVRTSRSTVGTMTELNDHLKLLYARAASLFCHGCGEPVRQDTAESIHQDMTRRFGDGTRILVAFPVAIPESLSSGEVEGFLNAQGYTRIHRRDDDRLEVIQDRTRLSADNRGRIVEALEQALQHGRGHVLVYPLDEAREPGEPRKYSTGLHCADCDIEYREALPSGFSFNSPAGACDTCRGFGRVMGIDWGRVIPDDTRSIADGAIKPFQTESAAECQDDILRYGRRRRVPMDVPWGELDEDQKHWVIEGEGKANGRRWYGIRGFFDYLESRSYKMHVRVLLSKYRSYDTCPACGGARLKDQALDWRLGARADADAVLAPARRFRPVHIHLPDETFRALPGLNLHDLMQLPLDRCRRFFDQLVPPASMDQAADLLLREIRARLRYLCEVGLGYLTLDRQSRTLSGGEVQRLNLTTALGTSLVNTLFVLDEPSIGLHPRDMGRVVKVLQRLRDAGNTLVVVEHDPDVMLGADRIVDMGPGPGAAGGRVIFEGTPARLMGERDSVTADYLAGRRRIAAGRVPNPPDADTRQIVVRGASAHNLKDIDVSIPLNRLVCVTGVSGSGKSTLMQDILFPALARLKGRPEDPPGAHRHVEGHEAFDEVVLVDQSPIGKTSRANPASYVGALDGIRKLFAKEPAAKERGYTPGTFSFNSGNGRCPTCGGSGFEHVEMQFLSDVYLRCPDCNGRRYRSSVLEVHHRGRSIADILDMTVDEAVTFFGTSREIVRALKPLQDVGLGYLQLGQPVPTLSGGEAQRLKLAGHLTGRSKSGHCLLLFDEPTTGLHFADIEVLLRAFERLLLAGHSVVVIEHNLDVMRVADWIIDLGPEGGEAGGRLVCTGTPDQVMQHPGSHTGAELARYAAALATAATGTGVPPGVQTRKDGDAATPHPAIEVIHAREHNLRNISLRIPRDRFTVVTGVSGSGKSTVAFDILFNEGQRRYLESLNAYARQFVQPSARPDVDAVFGLPPTVAIEQRTSRGGARSTVGTLTEIHHFLRLLFVKLGVQYCPTCEIPIRPQSRDAITERILAQWNGKRVELFAPLVMARKGVYRELAKWASRKGYPLLRVDGEPLPTGDWPALDRYQEHDIDLPVGEVAVAPDQEAALRALIDVALDHGKGALKVMAIGRAGSWVGNETHFSTRRACPGCGESFEEPDPRLFSYNSKHGWCGECFGTGMTLADFDAAQSGEEADWLEATPGAQTCAACEGARLRPEALSVYFQDWTIAEYSGCPVDEAAEVFDSLSLDDREQVIGGDVVAEILSRLRFLQQVGLGYLTLDRSAPTLSGGEAQRIRLAAQLGSNLRGACYILDEPTIGLHPRDNARLLDTLRALEHKGNTLVVVEHDEETIRAAGHVIDLGPGAGVQGGRVVAEGTVAQLEANPDSVTGRALAEPMAHPLSGERRKVNRKTTSGMLRLSGAHHHNLQDIDVHIPLGRLVCVTGVSGSGKSTLVREVLHSGLKAVLASEGRGKRSPGARGLTGALGLEGWEDLGRVLEVDQAPIGKTPRSCPATYIGFWDAVRRLFAATPEANLRGYGPARFSFNRAGGRCEACEGQGFQRVEMSFLPDVRIPCDACKGSRFNTETLQIRFKDRNIGEILAMPVAEAVGFFSAHPAIHHPLSLLQDVGLGYLTLGQQSPTLSGGEAQRLKLVTELTKVRPSARPGQGRRPTFYILDEPTVGLHMADVERLLRVIHRLVDAGHTVLVIEHNLDVVAEADWVIDLGPEGGDGGGRIVAQGTPEAISRAWRRSHTGKALRGILHR